MRRREIRWCTRLSSTLVLLVAGSAFAQTAGGDISVHTRTYDGCVALVSRSPEAALGAAEEWRVNGGGLAAWHCEALALARAGQFAEAGRALDGIADASRAGEAFEAGQGIPQRGAKLLAEFYSQAGNAWLLADAPAQAEVALSQGIVEAEFLSSELVDLYVDRARARSAQALHSSALEDLDKAYGMNPTRADILVFRASTLRQLDRSAEASDAVARALEIEPDSRDGLLERASLRAAAGDAPGAEQDLKRIILLYPDSAAAGAAEDGLVTLAEGQAESPKD